MIIYCVYAEKTEQILVTRNKPDFSVFSFPCRIFYNNNEFTPDFAEDLQAVLKEHNSCEEHWHIMYAQHSCDLYLSQYDEGFREYHHYAGKKKITIGSSVTDDIYVQSIFMQEREFIIYFKDSVIMAKGIGSLNNRTFSGHVSFQNGDVFTSANIRICFYADCFLLNSVNNCFPNLAKAKPSEYRKVPRNQEMNRILLPMLRFNIPQSVYPSVSLPVRTTDPFTWSSVLPMLYMAIISLISGILQVYENWQSGHIRNISGTLLFPTAMLLGCFLLPFFRRKEQRSRNRKETMNALDHIYRDSELFLQVQKQTVNEQIEIMKKANPSVVELQEQLHNGQLAIRNDEAMFFRLGHMCNIPFLFPVSKERICYVETEELLIRMIIDIALNFSPQQISMSFLIQDEFYERNVWLGNLPHVYEQNIRQIYTSPEDQKGAEETDILFVVSMPLPDHYSGMIITNNRSYLSQATEIFLVNEDKYIFQSVRTFTKTEFQLDPIHADKIGKNIFQLYQTAHLQKMTDFSNPMFLDLFAVKQVDDLHIEKRWDHNLARYSLTVPVGMKEDGTCITLDLHENGQGPHGLIAGTTGSGKSEWIISLLLGIAVNYSPREVQMVLIDFKGGGFINALHQGTKKLPHIIGELSNLDENNMERVIFALQRECKRRESLFTHMTQLTGTAVNNLAVYQEHWNSEMELPYLANLIITVDEFAEAKRIHPEFIQNLISIARIGRSLGFHMILATQKPLGIVDEQIFANIHFRICLKVTSRQESREILGNDKASHLKQAGEFYALCDDVLQKGRCGYTGKAKRTHNLAEFYDPMLHMKQSIQAEEKNENTQIQEILHMIMTNGDEPAESLWLEPLCQVSWEEIIDIPYCIGKTDDYYHNIQPFLCLNSPAIAVLGARLNEKRWFLYTVIYAVFRTNAVLCIIDDLNLMEQITLDAHPHVCGIFTSENADIWNRFVSFAEKNHHPFPIILVIDDIGQLLTRFGDQYYHLLEQAESLHIQIVAIGSTAASFSYRHLARYTQRIALTATPTAEISSFFEQKALHAEGKNQCIVQAGNEQKTGCFARTTVEMLAETLAQNKEKKKLYEIPVMPEIVSYHEYHSSGWALGRRYTDCSFYEVPMDACIIVIAKEADEMKNYYSFWKKYHSCPLWQPDDQRMLEVLANGSGAMFFLDLHHYEKSSLRRSFQKQMILYIGRGYEQQNVFISPIKHLKANEGIVFNANKTEWIRLVEKQ